MRSNYSSLKIYSLESNFSFNSLFLISQRV
ncbi:hypothetical protein AB992_05430 [Helicobacter pylori]|nr:hypothetical protein EE66_06935 [Helicobacter pylori]KMT70451.1 hypothetical protein AB992_05430 [Helicobacter pylori]KMZ46342.1 hypothetical protein AC783_04180 [Helicobacter pylori]OLR44025.1 hypothetical protein BIZ44_02925 [Helicobacter pylori]OLR48083.1 hypothetical protein BIZ50_01920 [Helicobacter pylori]